MSGHSSVSPRLLVVGKGAPDHGGIASFLRTFLASELAHAYEADFLNLAHSETQQGGRVSVGNIRRTVADTRAVWERSADRDLVHIHSAMAPLVTMLRAGALARAARQRGCRVVLHAHGGRVQLWLTTSTRRRLARIALAAADRVVTVSTGGRDAIELAIGSDRVSLVDNGVDPKLFGQPEPPHEPPRILYVGLLTPRKGVLDLLAASAILRERGVAHELWLAGGTPDEGPEAEATVRAAAGSYVRLLGQIPPERMPSLYRQADVFCLPSWWEAMPLSVLEAMASGLPVVASDVGDVARVVLDGVTGLVVPPQEPHLLASALSSLLGDPVRRQSMGAAGRGRVVSDFSASSVLAAVSEIYDQLLESRR